jgi:lipopolysaccharide/colanic/teichoic acid biosynthesis glycosyltransferase
MDILRSYYQLHAGMKRWNLMKYILNPIDILSILFAFQFTYFFNNFSTGGLFFLDSHMLKLFIWILPSWLIVLALIRLTRIPAKRHKVLLFLYLQAAVSIFFLLAFYDFILKLDSIPRLFLAELSIISFMFLFFGRVLAYRLFKALGMKGYNHINAIIVADDSSVSFIESLVLRKELGYNIVVIFTESELIRSKFENFIIILPGKFLGILKDLIKVDFLDEVLYLREQPEPASFREILQTCEDLGVTLRLKSKESKLNLSSAVRTDIADGKFLSFDNIPNNSYAMAIRKTMDINIALLMIVALFPVFVLISLLIKITSRGPIVCNLIKTGWRGQQVKLYRFRTAFGDDDMKFMHDAGIMDASSTGRKLTWIGKFLVMSGLDHLPQLFNILKGEIPIIVHRHPLGNEQKVATGN